MRIGVVIMYSPALRIHSMELKGFVEVRAQLKGNASVGIHSMELKEVVARAP